MNDDSSTPSCQSASERVDPNVSCSIRRAATAARLGVVGDFVRVPQLAKALGMSANSIYAQMRLGTFPIAHRRVGSVLVVKVDDYAEWFHAEPCHCVEPTDTNSLACRPRIEPRAWTETDKEQAERIKREVRERMRRKGFDV